MSHHFWNVAPLIRIHLNPKHFHIARWSHLILLISFANCFGRPFWLWLLPKHLPDYLCDYSFDSESAVCYLFEWVPKQLLATIFIFSFDDLATGLHTIANLRCSDEHGIVIKMIKHGIVELPWHILDFVLKYLSI